MWLESEEVAERRDHHQVVLVAWAQKLDHEDHQVVLAVWVQKLDHGQAPDENQVEDLHHSHFEGNNTEFVVHVTGDPMGIDIPEDIEQGL